MRRVSAPEPGTVEGVLEMARLAAMDDFDRARPMWKITLIDGLDDGGAAVLCKFHHALTDGVGGVQIAMTLFDLTEEPRTVDALPDEPLVPTPRPLDGYRDAVRYDLGLVGKTVVETVKTAPKLLFNTIRRPLQTATDAGELAASVYRTVRPVTETGSALMKERTLVRKLGVHEVPLSALREAAPPQRRFAQRRVRRRCCRRPSPLPRQARCAGRRPAPDDADQPAHRGRRDGRQSNRVDALRHSRRRRRSRAADQRDPRAHRQGAQREVAALHPADRRCAEPDAALVHRFGAAPRRLPVQRRAGCAGARCSSGAPRCACSTPSARRSARRSTSRC